MDWCDSSSCRGEGSRRRPSTGRRTRRSRRTSSYSPETECCWAPWRKSEAIRREFNSGELQPRFIPMEVRKKGLPELKVGDRIEPTVNDHNLLVDVHVMRESSRHLVVRGQLAEPLETGHDKAVLRTVAGKEESHFIRPVARSKVASVPVGVDAAFLIDELDRIVDVTFGSKEAGHRAAELWQKQSPLKGKLAQVSGRIVMPLKDNAIVIRTEDGRDHTYKVRPLIQTRVATLSSGDAAVLLVDDEHKVTDVAFAPDKKP